MRIWAHRGCSQMYPENTLTSFEKAMKVPGIAGIELDVQLTRDGELVVIHDERIDRTTDGFGYVRDYTLKELKTFHIHTGNEKAEHIPTMREVLELLSPKLKKWTAEQADDPRINVDFGDGLKSQLEPGDLGMRLNIELKNSVYDYPSLEQKTINMVHEFGVQDAIVYSTFYAESLLRVHEIDSQAELGMLDDKVSDCLYKAQGLEKSFQRTNSSFAETQDSGFKFALHPFGNKMDIDRERYDDRIVRAWFTGHLYPEKPTGGRLNISKYEALGITDIFLNEPEKYLGNEI
ncbi:glycerophosphodiester phosphodiesterase family protein [Butyrivibrio sp. AE2032]|uniref:glycerophosphodiester phosphodiesterase family protein n=1 Tax=Butyrivibrio sp. AE2032 TaxID=1458463 RepID=UPI000550A33B|nr:glycerophosphodiester phosphodiesterase family protein [Butyrivibrio sp. AE2032]